MKAIMVGVALLSSVALTACGGRKAPMAGDGWVSSGGELIKDAGNPWWLRNVSTVRYCIAIDEKTFSAGPARVAIAIEIALGYWKGEFSRRLLTGRKAEEFNKLFADAGVGTQTFVRGECDGTEDLRFQFGYGTLSDEQLANLRDPGHYIAVTARTGYDERTMRGRGFVYLASDLGPHRYAGGPAFMETPWKYDVPLYGILIHELGHVFGLPHMGWSMALMAAQFPEFLLQAPGAKEAISMIEEPAPFFFPPVHAETWPVLNERGRCFFELASPIEALHFTIRHDGKSIAVESAAKKGLKAPREPAGEIDTLDLAPILQPIVLLHLPPGQTVYSREMSATSYAMGPFAVDLVGTGVYHARSGEARPVQLTLSAQRGLRLFGAVGDVMEDLLPHEAPK